MEVVKQREAPSVNMQTDMRDRGAVREEDREKLDQRKDTHGIQIIHRLDKQLARQRQTGELTRTWRLTDKETCRRAGWRESRRPCRVDGGQTDQQAVGTDLPPLHTSRTLWQ